MPTGFLSIDPPDPADNVSVRAATIVLRGGAITFIGDLMFNDLSFPCQIGDDYSIRVVDTNDIGDSKPSEPLQGIVAIGSVPSQPGMPSLRFE